jgi:hypothetical protein
MTVTGIPGAALGGVLRLTWVRDRLTHVLEHCDADEPSGTWTGLACPYHGLALGADADTAAVRQLSARGQLADMIWEAPADLTGEHGQLFRAAIQAYHAGQYPGLSRGPGRGCRAVVGQVPPCGPGPGRRTLPRWS